MHRTLITEADFRRALVLFTSAENDRVDKGPPWPGERHEAGLLAALATLGIGVSGVDSS
jgi:hypothetical protein